MKVEITDTIVAIAVGAIAKRRGVTADSAVLDLVVAGLHAEKARIEQGRKDKALDKALPESKPRFIVNDWCSEEYLRNLYGDYWIYAWWAMSCSAG